MSKLGDRLRLFEKQNLEKKYKEVKEITHPTIAGRLRENSRNRFVDIQSKKTVKKTDQKNSPFH